MIHTAHCLLCVKKLCVLCGFDVIMITVIILYFYRYLSQDFYIISEGFMLKLHIIFSDFSFIWYYQHPFNPEQYFCEKISLYRNISFFPNDTEMARLSSRVEPTRLQQHQQHQGAVEPGLDARHHPLRQVILLSTFFY